MVSQKIATCCYCGTRAALVLRGHERHELSCSRCGAPLHDLKMLPVRDARPGGATAPAATPARPARPQRHPTAQNRPAAPRHRKKRKSFGRRALSEVWDLIEDILD